MQNVLSFSLDEGQYNSHLIEHGIEMEVGGRSYWTMIALYLFWAVAFIFLFLISTNICEVDVARKFKWKIFDVFS